LRSLFYSIPTTTNQDSIVTQPNKTYFPLFNKLGNQSIIIPENAIRDDDPGVKLSISGLALFENFLTEEEEKDLVQFIDSQEWKPSRLSGKRMCQWYGASVDYKSK